MMFQKKKEESNRKSLILYTNNYQFNTKRRFYREHIVYKDKHDVPVSAFRSFGVNQKIRYIRYNYIEFYYRVFGLSLSGERDVVDSSVSVAD